MIRIGKAWLFFLQHYAWKYLSVCLCHGRTTLIDAHCPQIFCLFLCSIGFSCSFDSCSVSLLIFSTFRLSVFSITCCCTDNCITLLNVICTHYFPFRSFLCSFFVSSVFSFILPSFKFSSPSTHVSSACIDVKDTIIYVLKSSVNAGGNATNRCGASLVHQEFIATTCVSDFRICV